MGMQDFEADLNRCKQMQEAAAKAYWESKFDQSEELYRAALAVLETVYATDSGNIASCLQGLGDSYYFQDKFGLALPYYKRLMASRERMAETDASEFITALFKLAKTYDKLGQFDDCEQTYKRATATAQKRLFMGHPLLTSLLEAYGKFLKRVKPGTEHAIEQQATLSREKYVDPDLLAANILEGVGFEKTNSANATNAATKKDKIWFSKSAADASDHWFVKLMLDLKGSPVKTFVFLFSPLIITFVFFLATVTYELVVDESPANAIVAVGQVFQTCDGHERVSINKATAAVEESGASSTKPYVLLSNRWRELFFILNNGNSEPWTLKKGNNLVTEDGVTLIPASEPVLKMMPIMEKISQQLRDKVNAEPKEAWDKIKLEPYTNPFSGLYAIPLLATYDTSLRTKSAENFRTVVESATKFGDLRLRILPKDAKPGTVLCLLSYMPNSPESTRFYIFGIGKDDQLLPSCQPGKTLYFHGGKGLAMAPSCSGAKSIQGARIVFSRRTKEGLADTRKLLAWDLILLVPFLIFTGALQSQMRSKKVGEIAVISKIQLMQQALVLYVPFALAYMCFTLYVIAKCLN